MRVYMLTSGILGLTGVLCGAFGAHGLKDVLAAHDGTSVWNTAVTYQMVHALALLGVGLVPGGAEGPWLRRAAVCWIVGVILFSGSLYVLALGGPTYLGPVTPVGGLGFLGGWACVITHSLRRNERRGM